MPVVGKADAIAHKKKTGKNNSVAAMKETGCAIKIWPGENKGKLETNLRYWAWYQVSVLL